MATDWLPEWGAIRSVSVLAIDVLDAAVFVVGHFVAVLLSSAVWLALGALFAAGLPVIDGAVPLPDGVAPESLATIVWLALVVVGPAVVVARILRAPIRTRLADRPAVVLSPAILFLGATVAGVAGVAETGDASLSVLALVVAAFVVVRRVVHLYAQHVRVRPLTRRSRSLLATAALVPLSLVLLFTASDALTGVVPLGNTGSSWLVDRLVSLGAPARIAVGDAAFAAHVLALLAASLALCGGYVGFQIVSAIRNRGDANTGPAPTTDRVPTGRFAVPATGSTAVWLRRALGRSATDETALPASKADWKYDDPTAERAHRRAQRRDPSEAVEIGEIVPLVLEEADYGTRPPTIMGSRNALKVFVEDVPDGLSRRDTVCVKVTDYGGKRTSAEATFLSHGACSDADRDA